MKWLCKVPLRKLVYCVGCIMIALLIIQLIFQIMYETIQNGDSSPLYKSEGLSIINDPVILWWTPFTGVRGQVKECGNVKCFFTEDRTFKNSSLTKVIMFYGTSINKLDLPLPRNGPTVDWALLHEESPKNNPILIHQKTLALFNYSATFSRHSHFPLTLQYLKDLQVITGKSFFVPTQQKDRLLSELAPVVYVHSDCTTPLERDAYVAELMKYIPVDSYGSCMQNKKLPEHLSDAMKSMNEEEFYHFIARYKFTLSFENAVCEDYITEKLWRPLIVGSVPVYMGSPSVQDWLPNNHSVILAVNFPSARDLADYLLLLNSDPVQYEHYLQHKLALQEEQKITNEFLVTQMEAREWGIDNDFERGNFIDHFECFLCKRIHEPTHSPLAVVDRQHYFCPPPISPLTGKQNHTNWWTDVWNSSSCEAYLLGEYIDSGKYRLTEEDFSKHVNTLLFQNKC